MSTALRCEGLGHRYGRTIWGLRDCSTAGRTTALVRCDGAHLVGPGLQDAAPTFDELVLGYLEGDAATLSEEALE